MDLTPQDIARIQAGYWAIVNRIKLPTGVFSFEDHEYQIEPMNEDVRRTCDMKATQGGFTLKRVLKTLHRLVHGYLPQGALYLFPTNDDVQEFSKSRFQPLILSNRNAIGRFVKSTDTASLKKVGDSFLYLRGARLSQVVGDEHKESTKLRSIPVDEVTYDEYDLMEEDVSEKARGRMGHSKIKGEHFLSNPTIPDFGIDKIFQKSDQRHWFRKCTCGEWTCAELSFPDCVKVRPDGTGYIGCNKCGKEVPIWSGEGTGEWVPAKPENTAYMVGRRWSQLTSIFNDPAEILEDYVNPPQGNLGDVVRLRLGLPYIAAEDRLTQAEVLGCCGNNMSPHSHPGPCAMGLDVGKLKHLVIGVRTGAKRYEILKTAILSEWSDVHDMCQRFNVKSGVVDIRPYEDSARQFQQSERYRIYLCEYAENMPMATVFNDKTGIVKVNRTEVCDSTHRMVTTPGFLTIPRLCPEIKIFAKEVCATAKVLETNKKTKLAVYRYKKLGEDHFRHALNYFYLAASRSQITRVGNYNRKQEKVISEYPRI